MGKNSKSENIVDRRGCIGTISSNDILIVCRCTSYSRYRMSDKWVGNRQLLPVTAEYELSPSFLFGHAFFVDLSVRAKDLFEQSILSTAVKLSQTRSIDTR